MDDVTTETIPEGRALDCALAKALGWRVEDTGRVNWLGRVVRITALDGKTETYDHGTIEESWQTHAPWYSTDPAAMLALIEAMRERGWHYGLCDDAYRAQHEACFERDNEGDGYHLAYGDNAPLAVARAAWRALVKP